MNQQPQPAQENKMGVMPVHRLLLTMSGPMMLSMLIQALYNVVDSMFVSYISEAALTAVSLAYPMQNLMIAVATGTGVGINALLSRNLGEKNFVMANRTAGNAIFLGLVSYGVFALLGVFGSRLYFTAQVEDPEIIALGCDYLSIILVLSIGCFGQVLLSRLLQSTGKTFYSMVIQMVGAGLNIVLDPIMIFGLMGFPRMGVAGRGAGHGTQPDGGHGDGALLQPAEKPGDPPFPVRPAAQQAGDCPDLRGGHSVHSAPDGVLPADLRAEPDSGDLLRDRHRCVRGLF